MKQRIWELDAFRGLCILGVIAVHTLYDVQNFSGNYFSIPAFIKMIMDYGGVLFVILSGICIHLGRSSLRRGAIVLGCGFGISLVMQAMIALGFLSPGLAIWFGVLHLLGVSMILFPLFRKMPSWLRLALAMIIICLGYWFTTFRIDCGGLFPLGLLAPGFSAGDFFPLFPHFGWFLLGSVLGETLYGNRQSRFPKVNPKNPIIRFFSFCGRHSLIIYLVHQPIVFGAVSLIFA